MHKIIITISLSIFFFTSAFSQDTIDFAKANEKTLHFTNEAAWDSVIHYGKLALRYEIDYFYLRLRLGMAYYYKQNYAKAINELEHAMKFNSSDAYTQELLYYSYVFSGRENDAVYFTSQMSEAVRKDVGIKIPALLKYIYLEGGPTLSNNFSANENIDFNGTQNMDGNANLFGNVYYGHLGAKLQTGKKLSVYAGFSKLTEQMNMFKDASEHLPYIRIHNQWDTIIWKPMPPPGQYTYDTIFESIQSFQNKHISSNLKNNLQQNEFYFNCNIHLKRGVDFVPFLHLLNTKYTFLYSQVHEQNYTAYDTIETHTQFYFPTPPGGMSDTVFYNYITHDENIIKVNFLEKDTIFTNFSMGASLQKSEGSLTSSVFGSFSNLNGKKQKQAGISLTYFPFGNLNLYMNTTIIALADAKDKMMSLGFLAGSKITKIFWIEGSVATGELKNYTEKNGFIVNNNPDVSSLRMGLMPIFIVKNFNFNIQYYYQLKTGTYSFSNDTGSISSETFQYQNHTITGGIKWKF